MLSWARKRQEYTKIYQIKLKPLFFIEDTAIKLVRTRRKRSILIRVANGSAAVFAPKIASMKAILKFVESNFEFIKNSIKRQANSSLPEKKIIEGELFPYLGKDYSLKFTLANEDPAVKIESDFLEVSTEPGQPANTILAKIHWWYKDQASITLNARSIFYAELMGVKFHSIRVKNYKSKWGSCSKDNKISYNWRIILAELKVIDYLVVHELAHIKIKNHSKQFWSKVAEFCEDHKEIRKWLRTNGGKLTI